MKEQTLSQDRRTRPLKAPRLKGFLLILFLVLFDQITKLLAIRGLKDNAGVTLIDRVLVLRYLENRGMAFGLLQGRLLFLVLICLVFFASIIYLFVKAPATAYYGPHAFYCSSCIFRGYGEFY